MPEDVRAFLAKYPWVEAEHRSLADPQPAFAFVCARCLSDLFVYIEFVESADFRWWEGFAEGKADMEDSRSSIRCGCEGQEYDVEWERAG